MEEALPYGFYKTKFATLLLEQFWEQRQDTIIYYQFVPNLVFIILAISYFFTALSDDN